MLDSSSTFLFVIKEAEIFQSSTGICIRLNPDFFMFSVESRRRWSCDNNIIKVNLSVICIRSTTVKCMILIKRRLYNMII